MELVDVLTPPTFAKSGQTKPRNQAWADGDWIGSFNLWIVQNDPEPALVYQQRSSNSRWEPGKLDVTAGGAYQAGESVKDGLREVREELGVDYDFDQLKYLGRKLQVSPNISGIMTHYVIDIFMVVDNRPLTNFHLDSNEVYALFTCPLKPLLKCHLDTNYSFIAHGIDHQGNQLEIEVNQNSFPHNWDPYHLKITHLAQSLLADEPHLLY